MLSQPIKQPFLVTGCGRSGTGWASALFTALGYSCGHEALYNPAQSGPLTAPESSWLAIPHLKDIATETPILRIVRDPYLVVQSAVERGFLLHMTDAYDSYVRRHRPDIAAAETQLGRVIRWVTLWDEPLDDITHRELFTGRPSLDVIRFAVGEDVSEHALSYSLSALGSKVNTNVCPPVARPTVEQIEADPDGALVIERARHFWFTG